MDIIISIFAFLFLIALVVSIHEGGHFFIGRLCGMRMLEFSIGFGKKIYETEFGKDKTKFTLRLLPLGGFVKPLDENALSKEDWNNLTIEQKSRSYSASARWKKFLMVAGGPFANFILAFIVYVLAISVVGTKVSPPIISEIAPNGIFSNTTLKAGDKIIEIKGIKINYLSEAFPLLVNGMINGEKLNFKTNNNEYNIDFSTVNLNKMSNDDIGKTMGFYFAGTSGQVLIEKIDNNSPASNAGIKNGDILLKINNENMTDINKVVRRIHANGGNSIIFTIMRNNNILNLPVVPSIVNEKDNKIGKIGAGFEIGKITDSVLVRYNLLEGIEKSFHKVIDSSYTTVISIKKLVTRELSTKSISGPIAIADYSGKSAQRGLYYYLMMISSISIAIGVFNLLPVPTLDGGHLAQFTIEMVLRKDIPHKIMSYFQYVGVGVLASIFCFSLFNDISKYIF